MNKMFREITQADREIYYDFVDKFYHTDAVNAPVPPENYELTFNEMMRSDTYVKGYIFEDEGKPCGFALLSKTFSQEAGGLSVTIEEIYIEPQSRGKGFGTDAIAVLTRFCFRELGLHKLKVSVFAFNQAAIRCYERNGFQTEGILKNELYRDGAWRDVVVMGRFEEN